jgi:5-methylcytosine-specific restriction endonuclease McrA
MNPTVYSDGEINIQTHAHLVLLQQTYSRLEQRRERKACKKFLAAQMELLGSLTCAYCHKPDLKLKSSKRHEAATVDHVVPKSKGGKADDPSNFAVCCNSCNKKKDSLSAHDFSNSRYIIKKKHTAKTP